MDKLKNMKKTTKNNIITYALVIAAFVIMQSLINAGSISSLLEGLMVPLCIYIIMAVSLNLVVGVLGELSLGHAGFMCVGAFASAFFSKCMRDTIESASLRFFLALLIGIAAAAIFGILIGIPVLRLKGDYLAIVTLGFGEIIKSVINSLKFTGGAKGLSGIGAYSNYKNFTFVYIFVLLTIVVISNLVKSRHGRAICAVRDNYIAAEAVGIKVSKFKTMAFVISGFFAGMAGVFYAHNVGILKPVNFDYNKSIEILVMVVLGGMGNIKGAIIAAVVLTALPEVLRGAADFRMLLYAVVLIAMMLFNNSKFRTSMIEKRNLKKAMSIQKEGE